MDLMKAMEAAAHGMKSQGVRMRIISENLANAETTGKTPGEEPYQRQIVTFKNVLDRKNGGHEVSVDKIVRDQTPFITKYDPSHRPRIQTAM